MALSRGVRVSQGFQNKVPRIGWLQTTEIYVSQFPEAANPRSRCGRGQAPPLPKALVKDEFQAPSLASGHSLVWPAQFRGCSPRVLVSVPNSQGTGQIGSGAHSIPAGSPLNSLTSAKTVFADKVTF